MATRAALVLGQVAVAAAVVGAYHVFVSRAAPGTGDLATLTDEVKSLRSEGAEARAAIAALERRGTAPDPARGGAPPAARPASLPESADDLASFRARLEEVERLRQIERDSDSWRRRIVATGVPLTPNQVSDLVAIGVGYQDAVRTLLPKGAAGSTVEERETANRRMEALRAEVQVRLAQTYPEATVAKLMPLFPAPPKARTDSKTVPPQPEDVFSKPR
jgi:hypothetical protein